MYNEILQLATKDTLHIGLAATILLSLGFIAFLILFHITGVILNKIGSLIILIKVTIVSFFEKKKSDSVERMPKTTNAKKTVIITLLSVTIVSLLALGLVDTKPWEKMNSSTANNESITSTTASQSAVSSVSTTPTKPGDKQAEYDTCVDSATNKTAINDCEKILLK